MFAGGRHTIHRENNKGSRIATDLRIMFHVQQRYQKQTVGHTVHC